MTFLEVRGQPRQRQDRWSYVYSQPSRRRRARGESLSRDSRLLSSSLVFSGASSSPLSLSLSLSVRVFLQRGEVASISRAPDLVSLTSAAIREREKESLISGCSCCRVHFSLRCAFESVDIASLFLYVRGMYRVKVLRITMNETCFPNI